MSDRWRDYIRQGLDQAGGPFPFALQQWEFLQPVVRCLRRVTPSGGRILEVGCGSAILPSLLAHFGYQVTAVDNDERIVGLAREMAAFFRSPLSIELGDAHDLSPWHGKFDVAYSLGVVEHFDPPVTSQLIAEQARCAAAVLTAVPTKHTRFSGRVTDERLYSRGQFVQLVRHAGLDVTESFVYGSLPTWTARQLDRTAPKVMNRALQYVFTYGMGICVVGRNRGK
jgi:SAM-dependent methyltransferase